MGVLDGIYVPNDTVSQVSQGPSSVNSVPFIVGFLAEEGQSCVVPISKLQFFSYASRLLGTTISPNMTDFDPATLVGADIGAKVLASGLWNVSESFTPCAHDYSLELIPCFVDASSDNATIHVATDSLFICPAAGMITAAAAAHTFPSLYAIQILPKFHLK
jgi:hypothetical protein